VLKITTMPGKMFMLEGKLVGPWVDVLRNVCAAPLERLELRYLDLAEVAFVDAAGATLLQELIGHGVAITRCSAFVAELLHVKKK
jgi:ABC-type transporter Mla MlaB component